MAHMAGGGAQRILHKIIRQHVQVGKVDDRGIKIIGKKSCGLRVIPEFRLRHGAWIRMICQPPLHLSLCVGNGVETVHNLLAAVF